MYAVPVSTAVWLRKTNLISALSLRSNLLPLWPNTPTSARIRLGWGLGFEAEDRQFHLVIEHTYDSPEDMQAALKSSVRAGMRGVIDEINALFAGRIYHVDYQSLLIYDGLNRP